MKVNSAIWNGNKVFKVYESEPMVNSLARKKLSQVKCFKQTRIVPVTFEIYASFLYMSLSPMYVVCFFRETIKWYVFPPQGHAPHSGTKEESWPPICSFFLFQAWSQRHCDNLRYTRGCRDWRPSSASSLNLDRLVLGEATRWRAITWNHK